MQVHRSIDSLRDAIAEMRRRRGATATVGFVPTMGNLHDGHLYLVEACRSQTDISVVSIYVNPLQFGINEDLDSYPRTFDADREKLEAAGNDLLFAPDDTELYPEGRDRQTRVVVPGLSEILCGASRPGHFDGVATVVLKLFNIVQPDRAFFGEKDYQQLVLLKTMVQHLDVPVDIVGVPTQRSPEGLALSSRNQYLTDAEHNAAPELQATLRAVADALASGDRDFTRLTGRAAERLAKAGFEPDYCEIRHPSTLAPSQPSDRAFVVLAAARLGRARLIDNVRVSLEDSP